MQINFPPRSTMRLTRRGKLVLAVAGAVLAGTAAAVPLLGPGDGHGEAKPPALVVPDGWRAGQVYDAVDKALALPAGSTRKSVGKAGLKLPNDAAGNPEGYLFPATYPLTRGVTPEALLGSMVDTANKRFGPAPVAAGAQRDGLNGYQTVIIASLVQAEAAAKADMGKVARVVLNRLERGMPLQLDSTINYALNRGAVRTSPDDTRIESDYNSYQRMGLPPTPIDNPGEDALRAVLNAPPGDWLYFVTVKPGDTRFTADHAEHLRNMAEFDALHPGTGRPGSPDPRRTAGSPRPVVTQPPR
ncbi:endolytic transglycosylase MltG [Streptomyces sp. TG1A-8]|uniref:endolytic transglycosylase MltG n=1 Tax=Streptomyces sp. TG1A-8 TaxID=3051385 RepID=UPI00265B9503|nr:endolytic transglycosylase MltG [Streptomyces sp. TG1A-8]MDO0928937.1 endolytic transglycosylase MltG [Streptomyces sp. TG1A-8]